MVFDFVLSIGACSVNSVVNDGGVLKNTCCAQDCLIWLGEGDLCLSINKQTKNIEGLCGNLSSAEKIGECTLSRPDAFDGMVSVCGGFGLFDGVFISYNGRGVRADRSAKLLAFGNAADADISVRAAANLIICLKNSMICGVIAEDIDVSCV